jgi:hypothetical protein
MSKMSIRDVCDNVNNELVIYIYVRVSDSDLLFTYIYTSDSYKFLAGPCIDRSQNEFLCICRNNPDSSRCE